LTSQVTGTGPPGGPPAAGPAGEPPGAHIPLATLLNLRDVGGWPTTDGRRVRRGLLYRSTELGRLSGDDSAAVAALGIRTVYDLRTEPERAAQPDLLPDGVVGVVADVLADAPQSAPSQLGMALADPPTATTHLGEGKLRELYRAAYRDIVALPSALTAYGRLFGGLAGEENRPALVHCTVGKDRTGWAAASFLTLLGVPDELVLRDYLLTNDHLVPALAHLVEEFSSRGGDPDLLRSVLGVEPVYLAAAFDEVTRRFGSIKGYFADGLGVPPEAQQALRAAFLAPAGG
jgi:protein-tyrosine phosphatase